MLPVVLDPIHLDGIIYLTISFSAGFDTQKPRRKFNDNSLEKNMAKNRKKVIIMGVPVRLP